MFSNSIIHSICFSTVLAKHFYCSKTFSTICTSKYTFGILLIVVHIVLKLHTPSNKISWQHIIGDYIKKCLCNIIFDIKSMCMCVCVLSWFTANKFYVCFDMISSKKHISCLRGLCFKPSAKWTAKHVLERLILLILGYEQLSSQYIPFAHNVAATKQIYCA